MFEKIFRSCKKPNILIIIKPYKAFKVLKLKVIKLYFFQIEVTVKNGSLSVLNNPDAKNLSSKIHYLSVCINDSHYAKIHLIFKVQYFFFLKHKLCYITF